MAIITGTPGDDVFSGTNGNDTIVGNGGDDMLDGGGGDDRLEGGVGADNLHGDADDDVLYDSSTGDLNELLDGGDGTDTADYSSYSHHIVLDLENGVGGITGGVTLVSIENLVGTKFDNDMLYGNAGNNVIDGLAGGDLLLGLEGDDVLRGGAGADILNGGDGVDTASYYDSAIGVIVDLAGGTSGSGGDAEGDDLAWIENVDGSQGNDTLGGNAGANVLAGLGGNDLLRGGAGADRLDGGVGNDTASYYGGTIGVTVDLAAGTGTGGDAQGDVLISIENVNGSHANDTLSGTAGANILAGWGGDDVLRGGAGADRLDGGVGRDTASYGTSAASVTVDLSSDTGTGGDAQGDTLIGIENVTGSQGDDRLTGDDGSNVLSGLGGDDVLRGGAGADRLDGGTGSDTASYFAGTVDVVVDLAAGTASGGEAEGDTLVSIENVNGSQGDDTLNGNADANALAGWGGDDLLRGGAGDDVLSGGGGNDRLEGGNGSDDLFGGAGDDVLSDSSVYDFSLHQILDGGDGIDTVDYSHSQYTRGIVLDLGSGDGEGGSLTLISIENLVGTNHSDYALFGNDGSNVIDGLAGDDWLAGDGGDDVLRGGTGADILQGNEGSDTASYIEGTVGVTIDLAAGTAFGGNAQGDTLQLIENITGSQGNDTLSGTAGANILAGWGGNDLLRGGAGADRLDGGAGTDTATYYASAVGVTVDLAAGTGLGGDAQGDTLFGIENVTGSNLGNDTLIGTAGVNILAGWGGDDVLRGGGGADKLDGGTGTDTASWYTSAAGVTVNLAAGTTGGGGAQGDTLVGIENLTGSNQGNDSLVGNAGANTLSGWSGDDVLRGGAGADRLDGGTGSDTASYYTGSVGVTVSLTTGTGTGGDAQGDTFIRIENINGSTGADWIAGDAQANVLNGWAGQDALRGGGGADRFVFTAITDSKVGAADAITDFKSFEGDRVDLSAIDANTSTAGDQAFSFIGNGAFTHHAGELRSTVSFGVTTITGDVNGDGVSDFQIELSTLFSTVAGDFVL
jgi:Ca2+-binding RTX toxin-like protein